MNTETVGALSIVALCIALIAVCSNRYELGLVKPKFKAADCIEINLSDEFNVKYAYYRVLKIGKKEYDVNWISPTSGERWSSPEGKYIETVDSNYEKIDCSDIHE